MPEKNEIFNEGNLLYRDGEFKKALSKFKQFLEHISPVNNYPAVPALKMDLLASDSNVFRIQCTASSRTPSALTLGSYNNFGMN